MAVQGKGSNLIKVSLAQELLSRLRECDPYFFEKVVGELLTNMGYGDCKITPGSGDKGVDGIVSQDQLGLERIFFQAKRYGEGNNVTARDVRDFVDELMIDNDVGVSTEKIYKIKKIDSDFFIDD
jgi:restriction system protein